MGLNVSVPHPQRSFSVAGERMLPFSGFGCPTAAYSCGQNTLVTGFSVSLPGLATIHYFFRVPERFGNEPFHQLVSEFPRSLSPGHSGGRSDGGNAGSSHDIRKNSNMNAKRRAKPSFKVQLLTGALTAGKKRRMKFPYRIAIAPGSHRSCTSRSQSMPAMCAPRNTLTRSPSLRSFAADIMRMLRSRGCK